MGSDFNNEIPQGSGNSLVGYKKPPKHTQFQPGNRANPGGMPKGTPSVKRAYLKLLEMTPEKVKSFQPQNGAEMIAYKQFMESCIGKKSLGYAQEITNRVEGPIAKKIEIETNNNELERIIIRVQERILAQTGVELTREQAIERIAHYRPDLVSS